MEKNLHIDDQLKKSLEELKVAPMPGSFDKVLEKLERKRRRRFWFFILLPGVLLIGISAFLFLRTDTTTHVAVNPIVITNDKTAKNTLVPVKEKALSNNTPNNTSVKNVPVQPLSKAAVPPKPEGSKTNASIPTSGDSPVSPAADNPVRETDKKNVAQKTEDPDRYRENVTGVSVAPVSPSIVAAQPSEEDLSAVPKADTLIAVATFLPLDTVPTKLMTSDLKTEMISKEPGTKKIRQAPLFFVGLSYEPQLTSNLFSANKNNGTDPLTSAEYLKHRRDQNSIRFNYSFGLKLGMVINNKMEYMVGFGRQRLNYDEYPMTNSFPTVSGVLFAYNKDAEPGVTTNIFNYTYYSAEAARIMTAGRFTRIKVGMGLHANNISTVFTYLNTGVGKSTLSNDKRTVNQWLYHVNLKIGIIEDFGKHFQLQLCPNIFISPNSMHTKDCIINQQSIGAGVEGLLIYKLN